MCLICGGLISGAIVTARYLPAVVGRITKKRRKLSVFTFTLQVGSLNPQPPASRAQFSTYREAVDAATAALADLEQTQPDSYTAEVIDPSGKLVWAQERLTFFEQGG